MNGQNQEEIVVIDATDQILGRMATYVVRLLKEGKRVIIINAEKAVVSGKRGKVLDGYRLLFKVRTMYNPQKSGIRRPRSPINLVKRTIRGMVPKNYTGKLMLKRVKVYVGEPADIDKSKAISFQNCNKSRIKGDYVTVLEISRGMGWNQVVQ